MTLYNIIVERSENDKRLLTVCKWQPPPHTLHKKENTEKTVHSMTCIDTTAVVEAYVVVWRHTLWLYNIGRKRSDEFFKIITTKKKGRILRNTIM